MTRASSPQPLPYRHDDTTRRTLADALAGADANEDVRVVIHTGAGSKPVITAVRGATVGVGSTMLSQQPSQQEFLAAMPQP